MVKNRISGYYAYYFGPLAGLNANSKWYWPCRTSNTEDLMVLQIFYWSYKSFVNIKRKNTLLKIDRHLFLFIFSSFISNIFGIILRGDLLIICPQMFTGPVGPVEVLFYWPKAIFGNFYWPGAIGPLLAFSPA